MDPIRFALLCLAGWMNQGQQRVIQFLKEEIKLLKEQLGGNRPRFTDDQRR